MFPRSFVALLALASTAPAQLLLDAAVESPFSLFAPAEPFAAGDVNGDGFADVVVGNFNSTSLHLGDGLGHFGAPTIIPMFPGGPAVELADLNGDGHLDLVAGSNVLAKIGVALGAGDGSFAPAGTWLLSGPQQPPDTLELRLADGDGDGDVDVLALSKVAQSFGGGPGEARLFRNLGDGTLQLFTLVTPGPGERVVGGFPADLDGNAQPDLVVAYDKSITVPQFKFQALLGQAGGTVEPSWTSTTHQPRRAADLDGDGDTDLLASTFAFSTTPGLLVAWMNPGDGVLVPGPETALQPWPNAMVVDVADLDADGLPDVALRDAATTDLWLRHGAGDGSFLPGGAHVSGSDLQAMSAVRLADIDGDGRTDMLGAVGSGTFQPALATFFNRTYAPGGPALDLGHQLEGAHWPVQVASGAFTVGTPFGFTLACAPPSAPVFHVIGTSLLNAPFKGGTLVPVPLLITGPWVTPPAGALQLAGTWTAGTSGLLVAFQFWFKDAAGPKGFAASSAVQVVVP